MKRQTFLASFLSLVFFLQTAFAADLTFEGTPTYSIARGKVTLTIPKIANNSSSRSGAIYIQVWAMTTHYIGGDTFPGGYIMAQKPLAALAPGRSYSNIVTSVPFKIPANGTYSTLIAIHETKPNTIPVDFVNVPGDFQFENGPKINMEGPASWVTTSKGAVVKMTVGKIVNDALSGRTGTLRLELWATPEPYSGAGSPQGYLLSGAVLTPLSGGYGLSNIVRSAAYKSPPGGFYYTTLIVSEYSRGTTGFIYAPRDFINLPDTYYFGGPSANAPKMDLQGPVTWQLLGKTIKLTLGKIVNPRLGNTASGALRVQLFATEQLVTDTLPDDAILLATANLGTLKGESTMTKPARTVAFTMPPTNTYHTTFVLSETIAPNQFVQQDIVPLKSTADITRPNPLTLYEGAPVPTNALVNLHIARPGYSIASSNIFITVPVMQNYQPFETGNLLVLMFALQSLTNTNNVFIIGRRDFGKLIPGAVFSNISGPVPYTKPPVPGPYFILAQFLEYIDAGTNSGYLNKGYYVFPRKITVR